MNILWVPIQVGEVTLIYLDQLSSKTIQSALDVVFQVFLPGPKSKYEGANLENVARINVMIGLITANYTAIDWGYKTLYDGFHTNNYGPPVHSGEGIRPDYVCILHKHPFHFIPSLTWITELNCMRGYMERAMPRIW